MGAWNIWEYDMTCEFSTGRSAAWHQLGTERRREPAYCRRPASCCATPDKTKTLGRADLRRPDEDERERVLNCNERRQRRIHAQISVNRA